MHILIGNKNKNYRNKRKIITKYFLKKLAVTLNLIIVIPEHSAVLPQ